MDILKKTKNHIFTAGQATQGMNLNLQSALSTSFMHCQIYPEILF